jgi:phosphoglycerate-specific signal transduction histidine kinase
MNKKTIANYQYKWALEDEIKDSVRRKVSRPSKLKHIAKLDKYHNRLLTGK